MKPKSRRKPKSLTPVKASFRLADLATRMESVSNSLFKAAERIGESECTDPAYIETSLDWPRFIIKDLKRACETTLKHL